MKRFTCAFALTSMCATAAAATVTIDLVAKRGDAVPGRPAGYVFWGESLLRPPAINEGGEVVFRARSAAAGDVNFGDAKGIYAKRPAMPLAVLVDTTTDGLGNPTFPVPGQPAGTRFLDFRAPLLNNAGDVVFQGRWSGGGSGLYATTTTGGPIVKLADTTDLVPSGGGALFGNFDNALLSSALDGLTLAAVNDSGQVALFARFNALGANGIYGTTVGGGPLTLLADSLQNVTPTGVPGGGAFRDTRPEVALNNAGTLAFRGSVGPVPSFRGGVFTVPVDGTSAPAMRALRVQPAPGSTAQFGDNFTDQDINESDLVVFRNELGNVASFESGIYAVTSGGAVSLLVDSIGVAVPNRVAAATIDATFMGPINEAGTQGVFLRVANSGIVSDQGIYAVEASGPPLSEVAARTTPAPGLAAPAELRVFDDGLSAAINYDGHMAFTATGINTVGATLRGIYFHDVCDASLWRIADSTTASVDLGGTFTGPGTQKLSMYQDGTARSGNYRGLTDGNDVAFLAQFSNLDFGMYVAHVAVSGGGTVAVSCPPDAALECPADTTPGSTGTATGSGCGTVSVTFSDTSVAGCGATGVISRTWTADNGSSSASCVQTITVADTLAPSVTCPPDALGLECPADTSETALGSATATDDCSGATVSSTDTVVSGCGFTENITRTFTATDDCGNANSCDQAISTVDTAAPVISVDTTPIDLVDADCSGSEPVSLPVATATDDCDGSVVVTDDAPATIAAGGTTTVTFSATDGCGNTGTAGVDVSVAFGANILVLANRHTVGTGSHPGSIKEPLVGITVCAYDMTVGACARAVCGGISHNEYQCILDSCTPEGCADTDADGAALIGVSPGEYIVLSGDATKTVLPDPLGVSAGSVACGEVKTKHLQQIVRADGKLVPGKTTRLTGSELLIIEPEFVVWDNTQQLYPFVFDSLGEWGVTVSVAPPEGFEADYPELSADVHNEVESVQFTIIEVGSDLVPTQTVYAVRHKGRDITVRSNVGIKLTPDYARSRGFDVGLLRGKGLIVDPTEKTSRRGHDR